DLVLNKELFGFFREERPVRGAVDNDRLDLLAHHAPGGVDLIEGEEKDVAQRGFGDGHGAAERVKHADLDGFLLSSGGGEEGEGGGGERGGDELFAIHGRENGGKKVEDAAPAAWTSQPG